MRWIEFHRRQLHMTQAQLAQRVGTSQIRISEIERGLRTTRANLLALAHVFGVPERVAERLMQEVPASIAEVEPPPSLRDAIQGDRS